MKYRNILTKQFLKQKYLTDKLSTYEIAKVVECDATTVYYYLKKYNIPIRTISEALKGKSCKPFSEEHKRKLSEANKGKFKGKNHPMYGVHRWGEEAPGWKGGKTKRKGYWFILSPNHPYRNSKGYVLEHRLVVEKILGRYLLLTEVVYHINGVRDDNRGGNLMGFINTSAHNRFHNNPNNVKPKEIIFDGSKFIKYYALNPNTTP